MGGEAGFLHHVTNDGGLAVAAGAVSGEHKQQAASDAPTAELNEEEQAKKRNEAVKFVPAPR